MKVSVITINYNSGNDFDKTLNSVISQTYNDIEYIVVDGGSSDTSWETINSNRDKIDKLSVGQDSGIADAFNIGIKLSSGKAIIFLNAGDEFFSKYTIDEICKEWDSEKFEWICGSGLIIYPDKRTVQRIIKYQPPQNLINRGCKIMHPSVMILKSTLEKFGGYDTDYKSAMDFELWVKLIASGNNPQISKKLYSKFYIGGVSSGYSGFNEEVKALREYNLLKTKNYIFMSLRKWAAKNGKFIMRMPFINQIKETLFR